MMRVDFSDHIMFVSSRKWPQKRNVWFTWGLRPWPTWRVTRLGDRNPQSWNGSNPMVTQSEVNIGMLSLVPKTPWIVLSSWEWFPILKEWEFEFWFSLISLDYPETSLFRSQPLYFWVPEGIHYPSSIRILNTEITPNPSQKVGLKVGLKSVEGLLQGFFTKTPE